MKLLSWRSAQNFGRHVPHRCRRIGLFFLAIAFAGIISVGVEIPATQAGVVVRFNLDYSVEVSNELLDYFDVELYDTEAPITTANFLQYVNNGLYDNTIIHRSVSDFIVQGGGFTPSIVDGYVDALNPIPTYGTIQNEYSSTRSNVAGTIAMAKLGDDPDSATSQWFVNVGDNSSNLDYQNGGFTVFGKVLGDGMTLINAINGLTTEDLSAYYGSTFDEVPLSGDGAFVSITSAAVLAPPVPPTSSTGKLSGIAYVDTNNNGVMDGDDYAIAGAKVVLKQAGSNAPLATVISGEDGSYRFSGLAVGTYSIKMETTNSQTGQDSGRGRTILDKDGTILSVGATGTVLQNAYGDIALGDGQTGTNFNIAQKAYPVTLLSARMLLNSSEGIPHTSAAPVLGTNIPGDSSLDFGNVLVGEQGNKTLTVTNLGGQGNTLSGEFPVTGGEIAFAGASAFGPLESGQEAAREYTFTPEGRGANSQNLAVTSNAGDWAVIFSGKGVAPVQQVDASAADAGLVRIGTTGTASITINNIGDGNLSGTGDASNLNGSVATLSGYFNGPGGSVSLSDNDSRTFDFTYAPTARATHSTKIAVQFSNGSADGANLAETVNVEFGGQCVGPAFSSDLAAGSALDFGAVPQADLKSLFLSISNDSIDPNDDDTTLTDLTLLNAEITGADAELFSIVGFTAGTILHEGDILNLEIAYNGLGEHGDRSALLTIFTDEGVAFGADGNAFTYSINASLAPEPGSLVLLAIAGLFLGGLAWRRRAAKLG